MIGPEGMRHMLREEPPTAVRVIPRAPLQWPIRVGCQDSPAECWPPNNSPKSWRDIRAFGHGRSPPPTASRQLRPANCVPPTAPRQLRPANCVPPTASRQLRGTYGGTYGGTSGGTYGWTSAGTPVRTSGANPAHNAPPETRGLRRDLRRPAAACGRIPVGTSATKGPRGTKGAAPSGSLALPAGEAHNPVESGRFRRTDELDALGAVQLHEEM